MRRDRLRLAPGFIAVKLCVLLALPGATPAGAQPVPPLPAPEAVTGVWRSERHVRAEIPGSERPAVLERAAASPALARDAQALLGRPGTLALLLIDRGRVVFEGYDKGTTERDRLMSFSIAKTMTAVAVGEALCAGAVRSLDDRADAYADVVSGTARGEASVRDLLRMASGARGGDPALHGQPRPGATSAVMLGREAIAGQLREHGRRAVTLFGEVRPGARFAYSNLDTEALARVVEAAVGESFPEWFGRAVMVPAEPEASSYWLLDREGHAVAHAGFMATLRDWGRLAMRVLALHGGDAGDDCMRDFLAEAGRRQITTGSGAGFAGYGYQIWTDGPRLPGKSFWMLGFGGQRIGIDPVTRKILVSFAWRPEDEVFQLFRNWVDGSL
ncbi:MAG: hypothetical protein RIS35_2707 [Pseudomonadota bacterium]|jgi:CubicO group peptidase (beta-lactamase class C family)